MNVFNLLCVLFGPQVHFSQNFLETSILPRDKASPKDRGKKLKANKHEGAGRASTWEKAVACAHCFERLRFGLALQLCFCGKKYCEKYSFFPPKASVAMFFVSVLIIKDLPNHIADTFGKKDVLQTFGMLPRACGKFLRNEMLKFYATI